MERYASLTTGRKSDVVLPAVPFVVAGVGIGAVTG